MARVLILDEERTARKDLAVSLRERGHEVEEFTNAPEALQRIEEEDFDVVLSDFMLGGEPVSSEILEWVKARDAATEVIVLTRQGNVGNAVQATREGAYDVLAKP